MMIIIHEFKEKDMVIDIDENLCASFIKYNYPLSFILNAIPATLIYALFVWMVFFINRKLERINSIRLQRRKK